MNYSDPWLNEPTHQEWTHHTLPCTAHRRDKNYHWCGYVEVPSTHPLYGKDYNNIVSYPPSVMDKEITPERMGITILLGASTHNEQNHTIRLDCVFQVHGGLTYSGECYWKPIRRDTWCFGFDCAHCGDYSPRFESHYHEDIYRDLPYVTNEINSLAEQLATYTGV